LICNNPDRCNSDENEEVLIERAIRSASWAEEVLIVDSGSTDKTCEIATRLGARVVQQPWLGWRGQHQRAVELALHDWVMKVDADEVISKELAASIRQALGSDPDPRDGFVVRRVDEFMGRIVPSSVRRRHRDAFVRIFNRRFSVWDPDKAIHEKVKITGQFRKLPGPLLHWRNASFSRMLETYSANADVEAKAILKDHPNGPPLLLIATKAVVAVWMVLRDLWQLALRHARLSAFVHAGPGSVHQPGEGLGEATRRCRQPTVGRILPTDGRSFGLKSRTQLRAHH